MKNTSKSNATKSKHVDIHLHELDWGIKYDGTMESLYKELLSSCIKRLELWNYAKIDNIRDVK